ncbi:MAG: sodium ion-translocating decarboxylase subunit beta [Clostridia bacterium]|nr:sodium ion-translocating decarboxylase subunit beta [Clostridia bacterium]
MQEILSQLFSGVIGMFSLAGVKSLIMFVIAGVLIYLAVKKDYEPTLLLPIGFGCILANLPPIIGQVMENGVLTEGPVASVLESGKGFLDVLFTAGIANELFPVLIFIAVGAMIDFSPLLKDPSMIFFGAAAQFGIFITFLLSLWLLPIIPGVITGDDPNLVIKLASAIGIIGAADGPTTLFVANHFHLKDYMGPISVAAYSYMALVPVIQPPVIKALTTKKERMIRMDYTEERCSRTTLIVFPIVVTVVAGIIVPMSAPLVGSLMFGNLIRECGVLERLSKTAQNELANLVTIVLGITVGGTMVADKFLHPTTALILILGLFAFVFDTAGGVLFAKFLNLFRKKKINPMVGAAGISAFPMSSRVIAKMALKEDPSNFILMQSTSANVSGQLGSIVAGGMVITLVSLLLGA